MTQLSWWLLELSGDTQYAGVSLDQSGLGSSHATITHNWCHNRHNHGCRRWKWPPSAPHKALCPTLMRQMDGWHPPKLANWILGGGWGCDGPQSASLFRWWCITTTLELFWGPCTPSTPPKIIFICSGGCWPSIQCGGVERKASCGALGGHFCWQWPWLVMIVLVVVGRWRLTSDWPTVEIVKIVYRSNFFKFQCRLSIFLTSDPTS